MKLAVGNDHAGYQLRDVVHRLLTQVGVEFVDFGSDTKDPVDFPDIASEVGRALQSGQADRGLLVCGTGVGASIAANKMKGIRAAVIHDIHSAHQSVEHDDVNVMCLGAQIVGPWLAQDLIQAFLAATFSGGEEFRRRIDKLERLRDLEDS